VQLSFQFVNHRLRTNRLALHREIAWRIRQNSERFQPYLAELLYFRAARLVTLQASIFGGLFEIPADASFGTPFLARLSDQSCGKCFDNWMTE
jgi:hypothetical protein